MNTANVPGTKEEKLEALRSQAARKGREFNAEATKKFLGIEDAPVAEPEAKKQSKKAVKAVKKAQVSKGKISKK